MKSPNFKMSTTISLMRNKKLNISVNKLNTKLKKLKNLKKLLNSESINLKMKFKKKKDWLLKIEEFQRILEEIETFCKKISIELKLITRNNLKNILLKKKY